MIRGFDEKAFQARMDARVGVNKDGKSIIRLMYAPMVMTRALGEEVPRYWTKRWKQGGVWKYEQPDRWVFEKRLEKESYWEAYQSTRHQYVEALNKWIDLGPPPEDYYAFDSLIAVHSGFIAESGEPQCCDEAWRGTYKYDFNSRMELIKIPVGGKSRCWGEYREPSERDLVSVERAAQSLRQGKYYNPYAPLTLEHLAAIEASANVQAERVANEARKMEQEISDDFLHSYGWRLKETDAGKLSHGRYHFLGKAWKAGKHGLAVIDN